MTLKKGNVHLHMFILEQPSGKGVFRVFLDEMNCTLLVFVLNILSLVIVTSGEYEK